ncbi:hypothetical protein A2188_00325 [Candidatus Woesebacteria bacterium RIFOXYA1_FULL_43_9]|uniref:Glycosyltransferase RgtA/B/C/D-like domain-containing protein n=1 Tax=Candidatus Woesebacteria bacterium RIFOXYA1_FULL_43_9 TaxID=1802534 RepID=A0A1F8CJ71_9BACT|nr:MAG: hypothetical protein A2188_00325 [Candidatus Woesebacteria bacterium RIFOXYA1_FULL_43_9]
MSFLVVLIIVLGTVFQTLTVFRSGWWYDFGMGFWGPTGRDLVWHQALVEQLLKDVPPQNPGLAGITLTNYHYFYDLLVAITHKLTGISVLDLIYRIFPVIFSVLFGVGTYLLTQRLFKNKLATVFSLFFAYFAGSFGWIVEWIHFRKLGGESAFWMNQPVSMNLNPPFALSIVLLIFTALFFINWQEKKNLKRVILIIVLSILLFEVKVYAGLVVLGAMTALSVEAFLVKKDLSYFKLALPVFLFSIWFLISKGIANSSFVELKPLWFVHSALDAPDRIGWVRLASARVNYYLAGNWLKYLLSEILAVVIFIVGNMGMRIIGLLLALRIWRRRLLSLGEYCFIFWVSLFSFIVPFFFVQKGNPWNTIQFSYYFLYFSALFAGSALAGLSKKLPHATYYLLVLVILLLTPISSFTTFTFGLYKNPPAMLTQGEYKALEFLKGQPEGVVLTYPYNPGLRSKVKSNPYPLSVYTDTDYVVAFSGKAIYLGDVEQQKILQTDYSDRLGFQVGNKEIDYVYLPKIYGISFGEESGLTNIFDNEEVLIYSKRK